MLLAAVLIAALHAALEDAGIAFNRVRMFLAIIKADILARTMVDRAMTGVLGADVGVELALVRHELALAAGVLAQDQLDRVGVGVVDVERTRLAPALHQADHGALAGRAGLAALGVRATLALR